MKKYTIVLGLIFIFCTETMSIEKQPYAIEKQKMEIGLNVSQNSIFIADSMSFKSEKKVDIIELLINSNSHIQDIFYKGANIKYKLNKDFNHEKYFYSRNEDDRDSYDDVAELQLYLPESVLKGTIYMKYNIQASDSVNKAAFSREYIAYEVKGYIGKKGIFLSPSFYWYPTLPGNLHRFDLSVTTPDSFSIITQGRLAKEVSDGGKRITQWIIDYPANNVHLVGSKFQIQKETYKNIDVYTYFFPESQDLAPSYLSACKRYLVMYENKIGPYPFSKFAVVENFFPTGYGMPSYTLLGSQVIRLPFIIYTSLGHEIAHNWWGNSVYVNYEEGNWCEGLTTYYADHAYKEMKDPAEAAQYRRDLNRDFSVYVKNENDFPLNKFTERTESASRAIGYGKSAMVFHQLRMLIGDSLFYKSFQQFYQNNQFKEASWIDIQKSVELVYQQDLDWFFNQWLKRPSGPTLVLKDVYRQDKEIHFTLQQHNDPFRIYVPIKIHFHDSTLTSQYVWLEKREQQYMIPVSGKSQKIAIDPDYDVFRILDRNEIPPTFSEIFAQQHAIIILPDKCPEDKMIVYKTFAEMLSEGKENLQLKSVNTIDEDDLAKHSLYILGGPLENSLLDKLEISEQNEVTLNHNKILLNNEKVPGAEDLVAIVFRKADNIDQNICIISIGENNQIGRVGSLINHYGKYSYLLFENGKNVLKGIYEVTSNPLIYQFE